MPVEFVELAKLISGIILLIVPGYLWSFILFPKIPHLERIVFGFVLGLCVLSCGMFILNVVFGITLTYTVIWLLFALYTIPVLIIIIYCLLVFKFDFKKPSFKDFKNPKLLLLVFVLGFTVLMIFLPHLKEGYFLPFHVDEWEHWSYSRAVAESGSTSFVNPYLGQGILQPLEIGFNLVVLGVSWSSGSNLVTIFVFMPSLIAIFTSLAAFNIGERTERKFGLEAAFFVALIPTTCRMMGPSFFVPVALGLLFIVLIIWILQQKTYRAMLLIPFIIWCMFLIHPPTALAGFMVCIIFTVLFLFEKKYKLSLLAAGLSLIPIGFVLLLSTRWNMSIQDVVKAFLGEGRFMDLDLPKIWISFEHMGIVIWVFFIIGAYFAFSKGKTTVRAIGLLAIAFITLIGLYDKFNYGIPIMYERSFLYLFLMVALMAGWGLSELKRTLAENSEKFVPKRYGELLKHNNIIISLVVCLILVATTVPAHLNIPYYHMINEDEYEAFSWIHDNIKSFRDENHSYDRCAVDPFKASPFVAISGLYIVSSTMSPLYGYSSHAEVEQFLNGKCTDTNFLYKYQISVIYSPSCNNKNFTIIYPNVYLYPGLNK
jgi:hypothetical protein